MSCNRFDAFCSGDMTAEELARHLEACAACREQAALDAELERQIAELRKPMSAKGLWERIETSLVREKALQAAKIAKLAAGGLRFDFLPWRWPVLVPVTAVLLVLTFLAVRELRKPPVPSGLLTREALAQVEIKEREYLAAIELLEQQAQPRVAAMDPQIVSLYRDKLTTIDAQIARCREALDANPGNAHVRRYLLAALHDKRQTLVDVLGSTT